MTSLWSEVLLFEGLRTATVLFLPMERG